MASDVEPTDRHVWLCNVGPEFIAIILEALGQVDINSSQARYARTGRFRLPALALSWGNESAWVYLPEDGHEPSALREVVTALGAIRMVVKTNDSLQVPPPNESAWEQGLGGLEQELIASRTLEQELDRDLEALKREMGL